MSCADCPTKKFVYKKSNSSLSTTPRKRRKVVLIGYPNTGKSTLFNHLTGLRRRAGNWPGLTVDIAHAPILSGINKIDIIDLPGIHDLTGYADDEKEVQHFIQKETVDLFVVILNALQLERQLSLVLQLKSLGLELIVLINMGDEAHKRHLKINTAKIESHIGIQTLLISAKRQADIQRVKSCIEHHCSDKPSTLPDLSKILSIESATAQSRAIAAQAISEGNTLFDQFTHRIDKIALHPILGIPFFFVVIGTLFGLTYALGTPVQDLFSQGIDQLRLHILLPALANLPIFWKNLLINGIWQGVGTVVTFAPLLWVFFILLTVVEDSGYLARAAFMIDGIMSKVNLDGRSFVMQLMGFGCNVPAIMGTRIMRSRARRLLTMLIIPFSLCSGRLQIFLFFSNALFAPPVAPWVLLSLYIISFAAAFFTAWLFKRKLQTNEIFTLEIPPYRLPNIKHLCYRATHEVQAFLKFTTTFTILGVTLIWLLTHITLASERTLASYLANWLNPIFSLIGIQDQLAIALLFGVIAKEIVLGALAVIYHIPDADLTQTIQQQLNWAQAYSFMLFSLLYLPCIGTLAATLKESKSKKFTLLSFIWPIILAWAICFIFYQSYLALSPG